MGQLVPRADIVVVGWGGVVELRGGEGGCGVAWGRGWGRAVLSCILFYGNAFFGMGLSRLKGVTNSKSSTTLHFSTTF